MYLLCSHTKSTTVTKKLTNAILSNFRMRYTKREFATIKPSKETIFRLAKTTEFCYNPLIGICSVLWYKMPIKPCRTMFRVKNTLWVFEMKHIQYFAWFSNIYAKSSDSVHYYILYDDFIHYCIDRWILIELLTELKDDVQTEINARCEAKWVSLTKQRQLPELVQNWYSDDLLYYIKSPIEREDEKILTIYTESLKEVGI